LFGWQHKDMPMGADSFYTMLLLDGKEVGVLYSQNQQQRDQHIPPHWMNYVAVASADDTAERVKSLDGKVLAGPFDVFDAGRMAVIQDPTGGTLSIWQANKSIGGRIVGELHTMAWNELASTDKPKAQEFYVKLFGWDMKNEDPGPMHYTEIHHQGRAIGGILQPIRLGASFLELMVYFPVANCDASVAKAQAWWRRMVPARTSGRWAASRCARPARRDVLDYSISRALD
jgi:predicted enzyme related to lactoylglutathione lyase